MIHQNRISIQLARTKHNVDKTTQTDPQIKTPQCRTPHKNVGGLCFSTRTTVQVVFATENFAPKGNLFRYAFRREPEAKTTC